MSVSKFEINFGTIMQSLILSAVLGVFYVSQQLQIGLAEVRKELAVLPEIKQENRELRVEQQRAAVERAQMKMQLDALEKAR